MIWRSKSPSLLMNEAIFELLPLSHVDPETISAITGPDKGFLVAKSWEKDIKLKSLINNRCMKRNKIVVFDNWKTQHNICSFGDSVSLYDINPVSGRVSGHPITDSFLLKARRNSAFVAVADGVNWGEHSKRASRSAIKSVYEYLECALYIDAYRSASIVTTQDAARLLFESFQHAQAEIVAETSGLTTLCVGLILPLAGNQLYTGSTVANGDTNGYGSPDKYALIVASVGDSRAFVLRRDSGLTEVSGWVQDLENDNISQDTDLIIDFEEPPRDFHDAGGALGAVYESKEPELKNLMCAVTICAKGDIIMLGTDGLFDNFDPVLMRCAAPKQPSLIFVDEMDTSTENVLLSQTSSVGAQSSVLDGQLRFTNHQRPIWATNDPIEAPFSLSIWPKPPPPPDISALPAKCPARVTLRPCRESGSISARELNYTDQPELSWSERRVFTLRAMDAIWLETVAANSENSLVEHFGRALLSHAIKVTAKKRQLLESPETVQLKAKISRCLRKKTTLQSSERLDKTPGHECSLLSELDDELNLLTQRRNQIMDKLSLFPGKLDHATVVLHVI